MSKILYIPDGDFTCESVIRNSRFIGFAVPVSTVAQARILIRQKRDEHPGCSHVVYAFIVGGDKSEIAGMSDDREPRGTAARPVMDVLKGSRVVDLLIMVVRYFGGTKLGTGGLVKAYGDSARDLIAGLPVRKLVRAVAFSLEVPYKLHTQVKEAILNADGRIEKEDFADLVLMRGTIPATKLDNCRKTVEDISSGALSL